MGLYGSEIWLLTGEILKVIEGFYHRVARRTVGKMAQCTTGGEWEWPPVDEALKTSGIWKIKEYIQWRQDTSVVQADCQPIYKLYTGEERMRGTSKFMRRWEQDVGREVE